MKEKSTQNNLIYKGKLLLRNNNEIYYGNPDEKYFVNLEILEQTKMKDIIMSNKVSVKLIEKNNFNIIKSSEKNGLYTALDIGRVWLERYLTSESESTKNKTKTSEVTA